MLQWLEKSRHKLRERPPVQIGMNSDECKSLWQDLTTKIVLVGTHLDVALEKGVKQELLVSFREADRLAASMEANLYAECSSKQLTGLASLFVSVSGLFTPLEGYGTIILKHSTYVAPYQAPMKKEHCIVM